jgi:hypothetical protein
MGRPLPSRPCATMRRHLQSNRKGAVDGFHSRPIIDFWYERAASRAIRFIVVGSCSPVSKVLMRLLAMRRRMSSSGRGLFVDAANSLQHSK